VLDGNGTSRSVEIKVPSNYNPAQAYPLTTVYHGLGGTGGTAVLFGVQDAPGALTSGIFAYPSSIDPNGTTWTLGCSSRDAVLFDNILSNIENNYCVNLNRVFVAGFSYGCDEAVSLSVCRGDRVRAFSVGSCTFDFGGGTAPRSYNEFVCPTPGCSASQRVAPVAVDTAFRFTHDPAGDQFYSVSEFKATAQLMRFLNTCEPAGTTTTCPGCTITPPPAPPAVNPCVTYGTCTNPVVECQYPGMGHQLPGNWGTDTWNFFEGFQ
jgi:poly(3-hydroxybutyrate) depolymerase